MSECPGVQDISTLTPACSRFFMSALTSWIVALCDFGSHPRTRWPIAHWLSEKMCSLSVILKSFSLDFVEAGQLGLVPTRPLSQLGLGSTRPVDFPYGESGYHICN